MASRRCSRTTPATGSASPSRAEGLHWLGALQHASWLAQLGRDAADPAARLDAARRFIDAHYDAPLDLEAIAAAASYSPYHFHRLFARRFGATPHEVLTRRRLERARALLDETQLSVTEICLEVGFESLGSFSTLFRRHLGHSPARYRRRLVPVGVDVAGMGELAAMPWCFLVRHGIAARLQRPSA